MVEQSEMEMCCGCGCPLANAGDKPPYCWACVARGIGPAKEKKILTADGRESTVVRSLRPQLNSDMDRGFGIPTISRESETAVCVDTGFDERDKRIKLAEALAEEQAIKNIPGYKNQKVIPRDLCECNNAFKQDGTNWCVDCTLKPSSFNDHDHPLALRTKFKSDLTEFCLKRFDQTIPIAQIRYFIHKAMEQYDAVHDQ